MSKTIAALALGLALVAVPVLAQTNTGTAPGTLNTGMAGAGTIHPAVSDPGAVNTGATGGVFPGGGSQTPGGAAGGSPRQ